MTEGYWVIRKYRSDPIGEAFKYWMPGHKPVRMTRQLRRDIQKAIKNGHSAVRVASRLANTNFREGDWLLGLDYCQALYEKLEWKAGLGSEEQRRERIFQFGQHELALAIRRVQYDMRKDGKELRYIAVTSDLDEKESGDLAACRVHHHLIVNEAARPYFEKQWAGKKKGGVDWVPLSAQPDYTPIVVYLLRQVRHLPDANKYTSSRNLQRPQPVDRIAIGPSELRPPRGAVLLDRGEYIPGRPQYIRYVLPGQFEEEDTQEKNGVVQVVRARSHRRPKPAPCSARQDPKGGGAGGL